MRIQSLGPAPNLSLNAARLVRFKQPSLIPQWGVVSTEGNQITPLNFSSDKSILKTLDLDGGLPALLALQESYNLNTSDVEILKPVDDGVEVWAAGVTYKRSQVARMEESESVVAHPGDPVRVRSDSRWTVPEPEFTLAVTPKGKLVGYTIGNDMSARDIEGENPLYPPQAKTYNQCCSLGGVLIVMDAGVGAIEKHARAQAIEMEIHRDVLEVFKGRTSVNDIVRTFPGLIQMLRHENDLPQGAFLLTGTGIVPPDDFTLQHGDEITMRIPGLVELSNPVVKDVLVESSVPMFHTDSTNRTLTLAQS